jgi:HEAT repeat protein
MVLAGCGETGALEMDAALDSAFKKLFTGQRTPQQDLVLAVSSGDPDVRRDAVGRVSKSKKYDEEWAIKGFVAIALLESDEQTRCVAIRALGRSQDRRAVETMLKILNYTDVPSEEVWPPTPLVRWDATAVLAELCAEGVVPEDLRDDAFTTFVDRLRLDTDRHARIAAARGLGFCPRPQAVKALIEGLRDRDFAVVHQCEDSLVRLTGHTHGGDTMAWEQWMEANQDDLFAQAGQVPASRRPPYNNKWQKVSYETKEFFLWLWPGPRDE